MMDRLAKWSPRLMLALVLLFLLGFWTGPLHLSMVAVVLSLPLYLLDENVLRARRGSHPPPRG